MLQSWSEKDVRTFVYAQQVATNYVNKCTNLVYKILNKMKIKTDPEYIKRRHTSEMVWRQMSGEPDFKYTEKEKYNSNTHLSHCASFATAFESRHITCEDLKKPKIILLNTYTM